MLRRTLILLLAVTAFAVPASAAAVEEITEFGEELSEGVDLEEISEFGEEVTEWGMVVVDDIAAELDRSYNAKTWHDQVVRMSDAVLKGRDPLADPHVLDEIAMDIQTGANPKAWVVHNRHHLQNAQESAANPDPDQRDKEEFARVLERLQPVFEEIAGMAGNLSASSVNPDASAIPAPGSVRFAGLPVPAVAVMLGLMLLFGFRVGGVAPRR